MAAKKVRGSLIGLLEPKEELKQLVTVIPVELEKEFSQIIGQEEITLSKGVILALGLFNAKVRNLPKAKPRTINKQLESFLYEYVKPNYLREDFKGNFIGRVPEGSFNEFHENLKKQNLNVYEGAIIAATLLVKYYKENK